MMVLVDTPIWSQALRRPARSRAPERFELSELIRDGRAAIMGPIRQELLSGVKSSRQFDLLRDQLRAFPDLELTIDDFELAAQFFNRCRARGIQGSNTDFLICAAAAHRSYSIFTTDQDFAAFARLLPITLYRSR